MKQILKEPLLHFTALGLLIFIFYYFLNIGNLSSESKAITITDHDINRLIANFQQNWNTPPDQKTLLKLIEEEIKTEIYYQEAKDLGLDKNDEIIRRRLKQKYEFILKDIDLNKDVQDDELEKFYQENIDDYLQAKTYSFRQFYFNPDKRIDAKKDAIKVLPNTQKFEVIVADDFHIALLHDNLTATQIRRLFGNKFTEIISSARNLKWQKPIQSGFGWHLVYLDEIKSNPPKAFDEIKNELLSDYKAAKSKREHEKWYQNLKSKYHINYDLEDWKEIVK